VHRAVGLDAVVLRVAHDDEVRAHALAHAMKDDLDAGLPPRVGRIGMSATPLASRSNREFEKVPGVVPPPMLPLSQLGPSHSWSRKMPSAPFCVTSWSTMKSPRTSHRRWPWPFGGHLVERLPSHMFGKAVACQRVPTESTPQHHQLLSCIRSQNFRS
jgi:hypothetical protein